MKGMKLKKLSKPKKFKYNTFVICNISLLVLFDILKVAFHYKTIIL